MTVIPTNTNTILLNEVDAIKTRKGRIASWLWPERDIAGVGEVVFEQKGRDDTYNDGVFYSEG